MDDDLIPVWVREAHMVHCRACGEIWDQWDMGISLGEGIRRIKADPSTLEELQVRPCPRCGDRMEWEVAIVADSDRETLTITRQRRLAGTIRRLLREEASEKQMADEIRERYGVEAFYVRAEPGPPAPPL